MSHIANDWHREVLMPLVVDGRKEWPENFSEGETADEATSNLCDALEQVMAYHREEARKTTTPDMVREELLLASS